MTGERHITPAFLFDLDGTLIDSVYQQVRYARPDPDLFLTAADRIGVDIEDSIVVDDSVCDLLAHLDDVGVRRAL